MDGNNVIVHCIRSLRVYPKGIRCYISVISQQNWGKKEMFIGLFLLGYSFLCSAEEILTCLS